MTPELLEAIGKVASYLFTSGIVIAALRSLRAAITKKRAGVSVRDSKRRLDLAGQNAALLASLHAHREFCIDHGTARADLPPLPAYLRELLDPPDA